MMADAQESKEFDAQEAARKAAIEKEISRWKSREIERVARRQREKLAPEGGKPTVLRRSTPSYGRRMGDTSRAAGAQAGRYGPRGVQTLQPRHVPSPLPSIAGVTEPHRPTYTRMARRHISMETLDHFKEDYTADDDPEYILIKRLVPEPDQDKLWEHTRMVRERRGQLPPPQLPRARTFTSGSRKRSPLRSRSSSGSSSDFSETPGSTTSKSGLSGSNKVGRLTSKRDGLGLAPPEKDGGLLIGFDLSSTISRNHVMGEEARHAELLADYGKKKLSLGLRGLKIDAESEDDDTEIENGELHPTSFRKDIINRSRRPDSPDHSKLYRYRKRRPPSYSKHEPYAKAYMDVAYRAKYSPEDITFPRERQAESRRNRSGS